MYSKRLKGFSNTSIVNLPFDINNDGLWIEQNNTFCNEVPFGSFINDAYSIYYLDKQKYFERFSGIHYITVAYSTNGIFDIYGYDNSFNENYTFQNQNLTNSEPLSYLNGAIGAILFYLRVENIHISLYIISIVFIFFILILCILFFKFQPLRSRGFIPILSNLILLTYSFAGAPYFTMTIQQFYNYICIPVYFIMVPSLIALTYLYCFQYLRYIILTNENKRKKFVIIQKTKSNKSIVSIPWYYKILNFLGKSYMTILIFIIINIILLGIYLIINLSNGYRCDSQSEKSSLIAQFVYLIFGFVLFFFVMLIDIILNFDKIKNCKLIDFWKEDIFYMRIELFVGYPQMIIFSVLVFSLTFTQIDFFGFNLTYMILNTLRILLLIIQFSIFSLVITIIKLLIRLFKKPIQQDMIVTLLSDPISNKLFQEFSMIEYSPENIQIYNDIQKYKCENDQEKRREMVHTIFHMYLNGNESSLEINIPNGLFQPVKNAIDHPEMLLEDQLFSEIEKAILVNISDTFSRFINTDEFKQIQTKNSFLNTAFGSLNN